MLKVSAQIVGAVRSGIDKICNLGQTFVDLQNIPRFSIISLHHKWKVKRLVSRESKCVSYLTTC